VVTGEVGIVTEDGTAVVEVEEVSGRVVSVVVPEIVVVGVRIIL